ncbi:MAG: SpoIIE family protein phosphatase [Candidatus Syntropharchaeia archaeon]
MRFGIATRAKVGESVNGDGYFIKSDGFALIAVIDGVGHGREANIATEKVISFLEENYRMDPAEIIRRCNLILRRTRGVVMGIAMIKEKTLTYTGIGNIAGIIKKKNTERHLTSLSGIVGYNLRKVMKFFYPYEEGDIIIMFSDGISKHFRISDYDFSMGLQAVAEAILEEHGKENDDATIVIGQ